jgi:hypothetical protein
MPTGVLMMPTICSQRRASWCLLHDKAPGHGHYFPRNIRVTLSMLIQSSAAISRYFLPAALNARAP